MTLLNKTFLPNNKNYIKHNWFLIDCKNQKVGRIATFIVNLLKGKKKIYSSSSIDVSDYIILINTSFIKVKNNSKHYLVYKPGRPGHSLKIKKAVNSIPKLTLERAIKRMLNENEAKRLMCRLKIYNNNKHPHKTQIPLKLFF